MISDLVFDEVCAGCRRLLTDTLLTRVGPYEKHGRTVWGALCLCGVTNLILYSAEQVEDIHAR